MNKKTEDKIKAGRARKTGDQIKLLIQFAGAMDLEILKESRDHLKERLGQYAAIGFIEGPGYEHKEKEMAARLKRLDALVNLIQIWKDTEEDSRGGQEKMQAERDKLSGILGGL